MDRAKYTFHKLTPIRDTELNVYADALDYVFNEDDLKNIAITGPYSSGKSSVLESYKAANRDKKFIHISLAHFETARDLTNESVENDQGFEADIKLVEGKVLNQLIHQIDAEKIPQTHFKTKRPFPKRQMYTISIVLTLFILLIIYLFNRSTWLSFVNGMTPNWQMELLSSTTTDGFVIVALTICGIIAFKGFFSIFRLQHNKNFFRKLSVQGNEIEIFENDEDSFFDKHLNEVLYLFRNTEADAIVFEDMDRYNSNQIFEKLREINYLLNNSPNNLDERIFRFFYLLRDDIFTNKDRTKFFDFIIPIVPVIDSGNSYDKFIEYFKSGGILDDFETSFVQEISMYIDDMRLLKNIYNEYRIYHDRIQATELSCNKLLAIIAYKNLFPRDFSELQLGRGYVNNLFRNKITYIQQEIEKIDNYILQNNTLLDAVENEQLRDIDELDTLFFREDGVTYDVAGKGATSFSNRVDFIKAMKKKPNSVYRQDGYSGRVKVDIQPLFDRFLKDDTYLSRKSHIELKTGDRKKHLFDEIHSLEIQRKGLENAKLSEVIQSSEEAATNIFTSIYTDDGIIHKYDDVRRSLYFPLIKYLVRNKYIDEDYPDYMSYFYEQSISRTDRIFIRSVFDVEAKPFTYHLKNAAIVASKISSRYYSQPEILNFDLFSFLLNIENENMLQIIKQLRDNHRTDFILEFSRTEREKSRFIYNVNHIWPTIWQEIVKCNAISEDDKNKYLLYTFYYSPNQDIRKMNFDDTITKYISSCTSFLSIAEPEVTSVVNALDFLKISFNAIDYDISNKELFNAVYSRNLYEINQHMVYLILEKVYQIAYSDDFSHKNYSLVVSMPNEPLVSYIEASMDSYISLVIQICEGSIKDNEKEVITILNHHNLELKRKESYIDFLTTEIALLEEINDTELWPLLLTKKCISCSKANILCYYSYSDKGFDNILTDFINNTDLEKGLQYSDVCEYEEENALAFYESVLTNNALNNVKYIDLLVGFGRCYKEFTFTEIDHDKMNILIDLEIIEMNAINLKLMREKYPSCKFHYIIKNIGQYAQDTIMEENFDISELKYLLKQKIANKYLLSLLNCTNEPISITEINVTDPVKKHILENNFNKDDLSSLISVFGTESLEIKEVLLAIFVKNIKGIIENGIALPFTILFLLLESSGTNKDELLASQLRTLTQEEAIQCFDLLEMNNLLTVFEGKWPSIQITYAHTSILEIMEEKRWISSFTEEDNIPGFYRVRARRKN